MNLKRLLSALLAGLMLLAPLASCSDDPANPVDTTASGTDTTAATEDTTPEDTRVYPNLEERTFGGANFRIWHRANTWAVEGLSATETTGEVVNDAVFNRNIALEEKYKFKIVTIASQTKGTNSQDTEALATHFLAGDSYDALFPGAYASADLTVRQMLMDLHTVPHIDLEKPWWSQTAEKDLSVANKLFFTYNSILVLGGNGAGLIQFNRQMLTDLGHDPDKLYQDAFDGKWTLDMMLTLTKGAAGDVNGDGTMNQDDRWGYIASYSDTMMMINGLNVLAVSKDEADLPVLGIQDASMIQMLQHVSETVINSTEIFIAPSDVKPAGVFRGGRAMFYMHLPSSIAGTLNAGIDLGILPLPKADENQESYRTYFSGWVGSYFALAANTPNPDMSGYLIEAMAAETHYTVRPAYYETTLKARYAQDQNMANMFDLILSSRCVELMNIYSFGGKMLENVRNALNAGQQEFVSIIAAEASSAQASIDNLREAVLGKK